MYTGLYIHKILTSQLASGSSGTYFQNIKEVTEKMTKEYPQ